MNRADEHILENEGVEEEGVNNLDHITCALEEDIPAFRCTFVENWWRTLHKQSYTYTNETIQGYLHGAALFVGEPDATLELEWLSDIVFMYGGIYE